MAQKTKENQRKLKKEGNKMGIDTNSSGWRTKIPHHNVEFFNLGIYKTI